MIQLSLDGVQESKSSVVSLDTYSLCFNHCRNIYPLRIIRPNNKFKVDEQEQIAQVLEDINSNDLIIYCGVFDKMKRSVVKCTMSQSSYYACEYCESPAHLFIDINESEGAPNSTKKQLVWPYDTRNGKLRTVNSIRQIVAQIIENGGPLERHVAKGINGKSHFLEQPNFNMITGIACEYLHSTCLGVGKRVTELTFKVGERRDRITKRKLSEPSLFNQYISVVQVVREFGRRCRNLDFSVYKAQEFRNIIIFFFPIVIKCIESSFTDEIRLWYYLAFMVRSCIIPNAEFRSIPDKKIISACENFYRIFEKIYGKKNCTYSVHVVASHLLLIRGSQPLTFKSAFKFESFFSEMKNLYVPGTMSTPKQILKNTYVKRSLEFHKCEKTIFYDCKKNPEPGKPFLPGLENNYLIYITNEQNDHEMYQIIEFDQHDPDLVRCIKQGKFEFKNPLTPGINWSQVGIYKLGPTLSEELHVISKKDISGKVLKIDNFLITCPINVLLEN